MSTTFTFDISMKLRFHPLAIAVGMLIGCLGTANPVSAQPKIAPDGTLSTQVQSPDGLNFTITGGNRAGGNLFHSFSQFSVPTAGSVFFNNAPDVLNIVGRVTGARASNIDGLLRANGSANLFLLNPNGITFGANARLDIGGSFLSSTATAIKFADGTEFSTTPKEQPLLTISVPIGLQYNNTAAGIDVQGASLAVQPGNTLALVGGKLTLNSSNLTAQGGAIVLIGVEGTGTVGLTQINNQLQLFTNGSNFADISASRSLIATSGSSGGQILITGRQIQLEDSRVEANTLGSKSGGSLNIFASDSLEIIGNNSGGTFSNGLFAENRGSGNAVALNITTGNLLVQGEARISTATFGSGQGGNLTVNAKNSVTLIGIEPNNDDTLGTLFTGLLTDSYGTGAGGNLAINTGRLDVLGGAQVSAATYSSGNGGDLTVKATQEVQLLGTTPSDLLASGLFTAVQQPSATGNAGNLIVDTRQLVVRDGAQIFTGTAGVGNGGNLTVSASEKVELQGNSPIYGIASGLFSATNQGSNGSAGDLTVNTSALIVGGGAQVNAATGGTGKVGLLAVNANLVQLTGLGRFPNFSSGLISDVANSNNYQDAGYVKVNTGQLIIQGGAQVAANNTGQGNGGGVNIQAGSLVIDNAGNPYQDNPSSIKSSTASGAGGNVNLQVQGLLLMRHGSAISSSAKGGNGNGGNITVNSGLFTALDGSTTTANAIQGQGGNIQITTQGLFLSPNSAITASSQLGVNGVVNINTPAIEPSKGLFILPTRVVSVEGLVAQGCSVGGKQASSRFTVTGRGGLPPNPNQNLISTQVLLDWGTAAVTRKASGMSASGSLATAKPAQFVEAQGWMVGADGEVYLTATPNVAVPYRPWINPASCHPRS